MKMLGRTQTWRLVAGHEVHVCAKELVPLAKDGKCCHLCKKDALSECQPVRIAFVTDVALLDAMYPPAPPTTYRVGRLVDAISDITRQIWSAGPAIPKL